MAGKKKQVPLRLDESDHKQIVLIAEAEGRTMNGELNYIVKKRIAEYRKDNPEHQLDILTK